MTSRTLKYAARGFLGSILLGACLFGVPIGLWGAQDAWVEPVVLYGKSRGTEQTVLGRGSECFCVGAVLGGVAGAIAGVGVAVERLLKGAKASRG